MNFGGLGPVSFKKWNGKGGKKGGGKECGVWYAAAQKRGFRPTVIFRGDTKTQRGGGGKGKGWRSASEEKGGRKGKNERTGAKTSLRKNRRK